MKNYALLFLTGVAAFTAGCASDEELPLQNEPRPDPHGRADNYTADSVGSLVVSEEEGVLANDINFGQVYVNYVDGPQHAESFQLNTDGSFSYQYNGNPEANNDSFRYEVENEDGDTTDPITVSISLSNYQISNVPPVAENDSAALLEDDEIVVEVLNNDQDANNNIDSSSLTVTTQPQHGSVEIVGDGSIEYVPNPNFNGSDSFGYQVSDFAGAASNEAAVNISVESVNDIPAGNDDSFSTNNQTSLTQQLECEDVDDSEHVYELVSGVAASEGSLVLPESGLFEFTPNNLFDGTATFTFTCEDDEGGLSQEALIDITVNNPAPVAQPDAFSVAEGGSNNTANVLSNDSDEFGDSLTAVLEVGPTHASSFVLNEDGSVEYQHDDTETASDSFTYRASDGNSLSEVVVVNITVNAVDDPPQVALAPPTVDHFTYHIVTDGSRLVLPEQAAVEDDNNQIGSCTFSSDSRPDSLSEEITLDETTGVTINDNSTADTFSIVASGTNNTDTYNTVLRSLRYNNSALNPTGGERDIHIQCLDGSGQASETRTLTISVQLTEARRISTSSAPENVEGSERSSTPMISGDGRYVVFVSSSTEFTDHDYPENNGFQIFRRDVTTGETVLVSHNDSQVNTDDAYQPCINFDGSKVAFLNDLDALGMDDSATRQLILADMSDPLLPQLSVASSGFTDFITDQRCSFSGDRKLAFIGRRGGAVVQSQFDLPSSSSSQAYLFDMDTQVIHAVSSNAHSSATGINISGNGRYVVFASSFTSGSNTRNAILRDMEEHSFTNLTPDADLSIYRPHISADGTRVVFESPASNLVSNDTNNFADVYVVDVETGVIGRVNSRADGTNPNNPTGIANSTLEDARGEPRLSGDGRYVVYTSSQDDIDPESADNVADTIFVKRLPEEIVNGDLTGAIRRIDPREVETNAGDLATLADVDFYGDRFAFESSRPDIVPEDSNNREDVFEMNNPLYSRDVERDTDGDGLTDQEERLVTQTHPGVVDSDGDGMSDLEEVQFGEAEPDNAYNPGTNTDPNNPDTDGDGELDGDEVDNGTNPLVAD